jgi:hypothetical protein
VFSFAKRLEKIGSFELILINFGMKIAKALVFKKIANIFAVQGSKSFKILIITINLDVLKKQTKHT